MSSYQALYYPFIHFKNDAWVKVAALYWDKLGRIVPEGYATNDSATVKALGSFVTNQAPQVHSAAFDLAFVTFVSEYGPKLTAKYGLSSGAAAQNVQLGYIYHEKIGDDVHRAFKEAGLTTTEYRGTGWVGMHPRLANVYMTALAEQLSTEQGMRPLTDETLDHVAISGLSPERLAQVLLEDVELVDTKPTATEVESALVSVAFQAVVPKDLDKLSVDTILEFREKYPTERAKFQEAAAALLKKDDWLESVPDQKKLEQRLRDEFDKEWQTRLNELRQKLDDVGIDTMLSCFNLKTTLPAMLSWIPAGGGGLLKSVSITTAALAFGAISVFRDKRKVVSEALKASSVSYLYRMEQDLKPKSLQAWMNQGVKRLVFGT